MGSRIHTLAMRIQSLSLVLLTFAACGSDPSEYSLRVTTADQAYEFGGDAVNHLRLVVHPELSNGELAQPIHVDSQDFAQDLTFSVPGSLVSEDEPYAVRLEFQRGEGHTLATAQQSVDFSKSNRGELSLQDVVPEAAPPKTSFTVKIVNDSPYDASEVFVSVIGKDRAKTTFKYLEFDSAGNGTATAFGGLDDSPTYSVALSTLHPEPDPNVFSFQCPREDLVSGRIYLSFGDKLEGIGLNDASDPLSLQLPSPTGSPDYDKLWEFMELSATIPDDLSAPQTYTLYANTSVVDFFSIGLGMTLQRQDVTEDETVGFEPNARSGILGAFESTKTPVEFRNYVHVDGSIDDSADRILRVLAPVQAVAIAPTGDLSTFLDSTIDAAWEQFGTTELDILDNLPSRQYGYEFDASLVVDDKLTMECIAAPPSDEMSTGEVYVLDPPTSRIVYECDAPLEASDIVNNTWHNGGSDGHRRLASLILAAANRGVLSTYTDWDRSDRFYAREDGRYNHYSRIMHEYALNGKVYSFGYDDIYGQDPTLVSPLDDVNQVVLTIPGFDKP